MTDILPTSRFSRSKVVGKALIKIGAKQTKGFVKRSLGSKTNKEAIRQQTHEEMADVIFDALGELKGISVKIAQQVALGMPFLPPAYLDKISKSFNAIPTINKALVRKIIKTELNAYPEKVFDTFEAEAFAGASLGQVHLATKDGEKIALKVQYPGIKKSIHTDLSLIKFALKRFAKGENVTHITDEIEGRLYEEVDYLLEATNCDFFRTNLHNKNIVIPMIYHNISTSRVIASSFIEGISCEQFLSSNPSQESRNYYAQLIFDNFFDSLYRLKMIHADPNPGNFLFMTDNRLGLIDFGCIKKIQDDFLVSFNGLHLSLLEEVDDMHIVSQYINLGMIEKESDEKMLHFYTNVIKPLDSLYKEPLSGDSYDFKIHNDFSKRGFEMIFEIQQKQFHSVHKLNEQFLFLNRTLLGYYALFETMEATIDVRKVKKLMKEFR